jgi:hypothetical protein
MATESAHVMTVAALSKRHALVPSSAFLIILKSSTGLMLSCGAQWRWGIKA